MYIQKVKLQNFRSFGDEGICFLFNKGINAVIGENNNGKTALIDAIRIAFSCVLYKKDIFFSKTDFHVNAAGERAAFAQIDVYLKDVPQNLIEIWDPIQPDCGEFHVVFTLEKTAAGTDKVKYRAWGGKCEGNLLSSDTLEAINLDYLSALRDFALIIAPALRQQTNFVDHVVDGARQKSEFVGAGIIDFQPDFLIAFRIAGGNHIINGVHDAAVDKQCQEHTDND